MNVALSMAFILSSVISLSNSLDGRFSLRTDNEKVKRIVENYYQTGRAVVRQCSRQTGGLPSHVCAIKKLECLIPPQYAASRAFPDAS